MEGVSYAKKDWRAIRKRFMKPRYSKAQNDSSKEDAPRCRASTFASFRPSIETDCSTGQDAITALALWEKGFVRLATLAPRAVMKGVDGVHSTAKVFEQLGLNAQADYEWNQPVPTSFRLP